MTGPYNYSTYSTVKMLLKNVKIVSFENVRSRDEICFEKQFDSVQTKKAISSQSKVVFL
jgi:hypothetical protein